ncbi:MAG: zf-HC2 domain-containing protein [Verrucomicrobia bacterium]|nr:zf-HC2 domain-containing protein [Verrucomicrobiota bacterium]
MNCRGAQRALNLRHDGQLMAADGEALGAHLAICPDCQTFAVRMEQVGSQLREEPVPEGPTPEAAWASVQRAIRLAEDGAARRPAWDVGPWLRWASAAALILVVAGGGLLWHGGVAPRETAAGPLALHATQVLRVTTGLEGASTMVYEDEAAGWMVVWVIPAEGGNHAQM